MEDSTLYAGMLPTLEIYESIERLQKPVIASVNGYAVGGGQVLQVMCDLTIAKESAVFRQVGPMMGSFDAGYGTWYLEDLVGKKKAKEMWFLTRSSRARSARDRAHQQGGAGRQADGRDAQDGTGDRRARRVRARLAQGGVHRAPWRRGGLGRISHDLLLRLYLDTDESQNSGKPSVASGSPIRTSLATDGRPEVRGQRREAP